MNLFKNHELYLSSWPWFVTIVSWLFLPLFFIPLPLSLPLFLEEEEFEEEGITNLDNQKVASLAGWWINLNSFRYDRIWGRKGEKEGKKEKERRKERKRKKERKKKNTEKNHVAKWAMITTSWCSSSYNHNSLQFLACNPISSFSLPLSSSLSDSFLLRFSSSFCLRIFSHFQIELISEGKKVSFKGIRPLCIICIRVSHD